MLFTYNKGLGTVHLKTLHFWVCVFSAEDPLPAKILAYNRANRSVAILCNHQRAVPKTFGKQMENLEGKVGRQHLKWVDVFYSGTIVLMCDRKQYFVQNFCRRNSRSVMPDCSETLARCVTLD